MLVMQRSAALSCQRTLCQDYPWKIHPPSVLLCLMTSWTSHRTWKNMTSRIQMKMATQTTMQEVLTKIQMPSDESEGHWLSTNLQIIPAQLQVQSGLGSTLGSLIVNI